jgi:hypothetical protein
MGLRRCAAACPSRAKPMTLSWTLLLLALGLALAVLCLWHQQRPRELGEVSWFPATLLLGVALVMVVLAVAHLITLLTGHPLVGRSLH